MTIANLDTAAAVGAPIARLGVSFFPVFLPGNELPAIATGEASGLLIDELDAASVQALRMANPTDKPVLVVEGEHFLGGSPPARRPSRSLSNAVRCRASAASLSPAAAG